MGIDVEDNIVIKSAVEVLYQALAPKTGRSNTLQGLTTPLHGTPPMSNRSRVGLGIGFAQN